ncbi:hypothetical protein QBC35DRAFT_457169 [Podospora australis]|uniref:Cell wall protein n=1 Tax=Podospora australis TaxID=1536484 RepID=A0AAN6WJT1_9PEZI|nr:hypothetical protein QBC35DRAFT_457169 [Podospora australis]
MPSKPTTAQATSLLALIASARAVAISTSTVVTVWNPEDLGGYGYQTFASVIGADATATTYSLNCGVGVDTDHQWLPNDGCGEWRHVTLTAGPSTARIRASNNWSRGFDCDIFGTTSASCNFILDGDRTKDNMIAGPGTWPAYIPDEDDEDLYSGTWFPEWYQAVTVTAGIEKLSGGGKQKAQTNLNTAASATTTTVASGAGETGFPASTGSSPVSPGVQETDTPSASGSTAVPTSGAGSLLNAAGVRTLGAIGVAAFLGLTLA